MNEREFSAFLRELGIPESKSFREKKELISLKMAEFQDSPQYMEDGADEKQELFDAAMDYAEEMQKMQESGIMLDNAEESVRDPEILTSPAAVNEADIDTLKNRGQRVSNAADNVTEIEVTSQSASNPQGGSTSGGTAQPQGSVSQPVTHAQWFKSVNGADNIDNLFIQAIDNITYDEWDKASRVLDSIINAEPRNPGAFLAKAFVDFRIRDIKELEFLTDNVVSFNKLAGNTNLRRARDYGDNAQSRELTAYINDNANYRKYLAAEKDYQKSNKTDLNLVKSALSGFEAISGYRDADARAAEVKSLIGTLKDKKKDDEYNDAVKALKASVVKGDYEKAEKKLKALGDYKDAKDLLNTCQKEIRSQQKLEAARYKTRTIINRIARILVVLALLLVGPGNGDFIEADHEGWFPDMDKAIHRFVPVPVLSDQEKDIYGRVYLGTGILNVEAEKPGLPVFAPFAKEIVFRDDNGDRIEK